MSFPFSPGDDTIVEPAGFDPAQAAEGLQTFRPAHYGTSRNREAQLDRPGDLGLVSGWCSGCGERQIQLSLQTPNGKVQWIKLRPSMAIKLAELLIIHARVGSTAQ